jgi:hypothetical protein
MYVGRQKNEGIHLLTKMRFSEPSLFTGLPSLLVNENFFPVANPTFFGGGGSATPCASPPPRPTIFSDYSFLAHHLANRDDQHFLAHAMASVEPILLKIVSYNTTNSLGTYVFS